MHLHSKLTRRRFLVRAAVPTIAAVVELGTPRVVRAAAGVVAITVVPVRGPAPIPVTLHVNGQMHRLSIEPRVTLLDALRERLQLTGTKKGCDQGQCGACTVLVDDRRVNACLTLAVAVEGKRVTTVEGLAHGNALHPVQQAFIDEDAFQCGYCTPGQICSAVGPAERAARAERRERARVHERQHLPLRRVHEHRRGDPSRGAPRLMRPFGYARASSTADALATLAQHPRGAFLAGGTNIVDLIKIDVAMPDTLIDINALPLAAIAADARRPRAHRRARAHVGHGGSIR